jgi:hypothetical protein
MELQSVDCSVASLGLCGRIGFEQGLQSEPWRCNACAASEVRQRRHDVGVKCSLDFGSQG